ncbi:MAG TPA: oxidoreductase-like domain-containing protein [Albitalea sp.]|nr:oxidoreductase-like domain-containing protein [Albitalea sp.]
MPALAPDDDPEPAAPLPPDDGACCGNGCDPCVYDLYQAERERHAAALRAWRQRQDERRRSGRDGRD